MFDLNFIAESGLQKISSDACWSYLHKIEANNNKIEQKIPVSESKKITSKTRYYVWTVYAFLLIAGLSFYFKPQKTVSSDMVLNQVVDLIIESGYMKDIQLTEAHFMHQSAKVIITSDKLNKIQNFIRGYRREDNIPFEIFQKNNKSYVSLNFRWDGGIKGGDIAILKSLAAKTVFSNKISINYNENQFELKGRSSDIISYLLQMAENELMQKFIFSIFHLESGSFFLKVQVD